MLVTLAAAHPSLERGEDLASAIFSALRVVDWEARESSNWSEGRYFSAQAEGASLKVSFGDTDHSDRPIGIFISGSQSAVARATSLCVERLKPLGFAVSRLQHWGRPDEKRVEL